MRYYLVSFVDNQVRDKWRDSRRILVKYQRSLLMRELDELYFVYKYLGEDLEPEEIGWISSGLEKFVQGANIMSFTHPIMPVKVGRKSGELSSREIALHLKQTPELKQLFRIINDRVVGLSGDVVRRKDNNRWLGKVRLATIRPNASVPQQQEIANLVKTLPFPNEVVINNIGIIGLEVYNHKPRLKRIKEIELRLQ